METRLFKKNRFTFFIIIFFLTVFILFLQVKNIFFPASDTANYGNRLNGLTEIKKETKTELVEKLKENESVKEVTTQTSGRIFNVIITVLKDTSLKAAKKIGASTIETLDEETLKQYDIQVFVKKAEKEENDFPIIGYKSKTEKEFSWTKDREKKEPETEEGEE